ncbi:isochorismatase family cysteine hydrolase [Bacillus thermotolerans]|uniref:isochorismatase family cysteine hydrolase n=1 Tax=Bacillus thermotolerans TaxID=1221996 RepID=UPI00057FDEB2|nr:isochorismatase family cysteine hydrolase [Bacillus thermotolerans]KKB33331.1 Nicotinamidase [Bacillus thermotolerans]KKB35818.1 Nicotinamidase [Bacillus thermotolerans]
MERRNKYALLIIDLINDFDFQMGEPLAENTLDICPSVVKLKQFCKQQDIPVIYVNDHYGIWKADLDAILDYASNDRSEPIIQQIKPESDDYFLIKPKHSAFYGTALNTLLHEVGADSVIVTGVAGNICVFFTANDAYMREYNICVPKDAIASETEKDNHYALEMMKTVLNADTRKVDQFIEEYKAPFL